MYVCIEVSNKCHPLSYKTFKLHNWLVKIPFQDISLYQCHPLIFFLTFMLHNLFEVRWHDTSKSIGGKFKIKGWPFLTQNDPFWPKFRPKQPNLTKNIFFVILKSYDFQRGVTCLCLKMFNFSVRFGTVLAPFWERFGSVLETLWWKRFELNFGSISDYAWIKFW